MDCVSLFLRSKHMTFSGDRSEFAYPAHNLFMKNRFITQWIGSKWRAFSVDWSLPFGKQSLNYSVYLGKAKGVKSVTSLSIFYSYTYWTVANMIFMCWKSCSTFQAACIELVHLESQFFELNATTFRSTKICCLLTLTLAFRV